MIDNKVEVDILEIFTTYSSSIDWVTDKINPRIMFFHYDEEPPFFQDSEKRQQKYQTCMSTY